MTKQITVPEPIACTNVATKEPLKRLVQEAVYTGEDDKKRLITPAVFETDEPWSLYRALAIFVGQRPEWQKPLSKSLRFSAFLTKLDEVKVGKIVDITVELWKQLRDTLEDDDFEIPYPYNLQLPPLFNAVLLATGPVEEEEATSTDAAAADKPEVKS